MTTSAGVMAVGENPSEIPDGQIDAVWVQHGAAVDEIEFYDDSDVLRLTLAQLDGSLVWRRHLEERVIVVASERGRQAYLVDLATWRILKEVIIWRDDDHYWNRMDILVTPDESRCVLLSDTLVQVLTWRGTLLYARRIETTDRFVSLSNDSITLMDEPNGGLLFTLPFPRTLPFQSQ
jgi:hypothetical protein